MSSFNFVISAGKKNSVNIATCEVHRKNGKHEIHPNPRYHIQY